MTSTPVPNARSARNRALRATLAVATNDLAALAVVLEEAAADTPHGVGQLIVALAEATAANASALADDWIDQLRFMIRAEDALTPDADQ